MNPITKKVSTSLACFVALALSFAAAPASAVPDFKTVGGMRDNCRLSMEKWEELDPQEMVQATACSSYIGGVIDILITNCRSDFGETAPEILKADYGHTLKAYVQGFLNWADQNPNRWSDKKVVGLTEAISSEFPCTE